MSCKIPLFYVFLLRYILRPYLPTRSTKKTRLSGYGVELQIKSTEYKAQDDRKVDASGEDAGQEGGQDEQDEQDKVRKKFSYFGGA